MRRCAKHFYVLAAAAPVAARRLRRAAAEAHAHAYPPQCPGHPLALRSRLARAAPAPRSALRASPGQAMDSSHVSLVALKLKAGGFDE